MKMLMTDEERINNIFSLYGLSQHTDCSCIKSSMRRTLYQELINFATSIRADCASQRGGESGDLHNLLENDEQLSGNKDE